MRHSLIALLIGVSAATSAAGAIENTCTNRRSERYHVDAARLAAGGFGASRPKESNDTAEGRARNRRVELVRQ